MRNYDDNELSNLISDEIDQKRENNNDFKKMTKLGNQIERYAKYTHKFLDNFERNLENIACANTIEEFNIAVGAYSKDKFDMKELK